MATLFEKRARAPTDVLFQELEGECVLLNLKSEKYFGLDDVGTRMWQLLTTCESVQAAYETLLNEYKVEPEQLRKELDELLEKLVEYELVEIGDR